ncbi:kinase-like domain-containing protein [Rhodofomes roseus]|uniref:Kinase-like domain-containing protein n=1 Tax=Rhodofomes roseus TaxID=34475 RepID=A0ABQ8KN50_9APHY|nr:kinase-like domain-containing protein [Rhodofomes roseus]KAH9839832.1 kinase-like domain-containing protein [Rhodofomes roseus]
MSLTPRRNKKEDDPKMIGLWKIGRTIGKGSCGRVRIARHSKTGQYAAVKIVSKTSIMNSRMALHSPSDQADRMYSIEREIVVMKLIEHPNIMRLYDVWETSSELYLILEYVEGGELFDYLCEKRRLSTYEALGFFQQIIAAVNYCHRFNIAHRDLKPENLLLDQNKNIKVVDFGMAAWQGKADLLRTSCGSPHYAAPEVVMGCTYNGASADIWSCGVILYALLAGRLPFDDEDLDTLLDKVKGGKFVMPGDIDPRASDLISRMLTKDVAKRITIPEIMQHRFFTSQPPKKMDCDVPNLDEIARPLSSEDDIDCDIFGNLRSLWHGRSDEEIIASLLNKEPSWEKGVYHLLVRYRMTHMENYDEEEEEKVVAKRVSKRRAKRDQENAGERSELLASLPPRAGPPTPSRAAREGQPQVSPSPSRGLSQMRQLSFLNSSLALNSMADASTPRKPRAQPSSSSAATPASALLSPLPATSASPAVPTGGVMQDDRIQQFMLQISEHLSVMQPAGSRPPLDSVQTPRATAAPPPTPYAMDPRSPGRDMQTPLGRRGMATADIFGVEGPAQSKTTRPLSVRPRSPAKSVASVDKENVPRLTVDTRIGAHYMHSPGRRSSAYSTDSGRRVQILEPPVIERGRLKKRRNPGQSPTSPASSAMSTGSSFVMSSTPRRRWFPQLFKFKPTQFHLLSVADAHRSVSTCRQILEQMGVTTALAYEPSEDPASPDSDTFTLKCWLEDPRDTRGAMSSLKGVRFRVEVHRPSSIQTIAGYAVLLSLVLEKGAATTLKLVYNRLRRGWDLDSQDLPPASRSHEVEDDERFVEVVYAQ